MAKHRTIEDQKTEDSTLLGCTASGNAKDERHGEAWRPIETAPKDGTWILLWWPFWAKNRPTLGWFGYRGIQQWSSVDTLEGDGDEPTHWMPLPAPPRDVA